MLYLSNNDFNSEYVLPITLDEPINKTSLVTTASFNAYTSSTNTFTSSVQTQANALQAATSSYITNAQNKSLGWSC